MIYDTLDNIDQYCCDGEPLRRALDFAITFDPSQPDGRYEIDGDNIFANVMSYTTFPAEQLKFESHKNHIDVQILLESEELMDISHDKDLEVDTPYSEQSDATLFKAPRRFSTVVLNPGCFAAVFPSDLHRPSRFVDAPKMVRKVVVKVRVI
jgi:biofilm protein TabA